MTPQPSANRPATLFTSEFLRIWGFGFITFLSAFQLFPAIPFHILDLGGDRATAGWFLAAYTYASAFAAPVTGSISDRFGRKRILMLAAFSFIFLSLLYGAITNIAILLVFAMLHGGIWSGILASSAAMMSDLVPESRRTEGIAYWGMASTAAVAVAPWIGLFLYRRFGWFVLCCELAVLSIAMLILAARVKEVGSGSVRAKGFKIDLRVTAVAMALFAVSFGYGGVTSYVALMAIERKLEPASLFFTCFAITIIVMRIFTARLGDTHGPLRVLYPSLLLVPVALAILATASSTWQIVLAAILFGSGFGGAYPAFVTFVLAKTDPDRRGGTFGSILWAFDTGIGTGSLVTGLLSQRVGFQFAYLVAAAVGCLAVPIFLVASRLLPAPGSRGTAVA
ncbi:MAG TPA: MFS transporter [Thermoanaerobaculia bacterium]|nr:MFS transporter [Thermoanaerobaculia bacterium]